MLDAQGRIAIGNELISRCDNIDVRKSINILYVPNKKAILIVPEDIMAQEGEYFIRTTNMDIKGRIFLPAPIRNAFPNATYLPAEKDGKIYIFIIEHEKKPE